MPAKDIYHETVKRALVKDGWVITHDSYTLKFGKRDLFIDLGAEELVAADKEGRKIAVEIKSFSGASLMTDLERALGQFTLYRTLLEQSEPTRILYLAMDAVAYEEIFEDPLGQWLVNRNDLHILIFDIEGESVRQWIP